MYYSAMWGGGLRGGKWVLYLKLSMREVNEWASWNQLSIDRWHWSPSLRIGLKQIMGLNIFFLFPKQKSHWDSFALDFYFWLKYSTLKEGRILHHISWSKRIEERVKEIPNKNPHTSCVGGKKELNKQ